MKYGFFPPEHHDFIATDAIRKEAEHNRELMEARLQVEISHFRAEVEHKLGQHTDIAQGNIYAYFYQEAGPDTIGGGVCTLSGQLKTLILLLRGSDRNAGEDVPTGIRIITNEPVVSEHGHQWLTVDFTLDAKDNLRYLVDAFNPAEQNAEQALGPLFQVDADGHLRVSANYQSVTPGIGLKPEKRPDEVIEPFGSDGDTRDREHALNVGRELFIQVQDAEPLRVSSL